MRLVDAIDAWRRGGPPALAVAAAAAAATSPLWAAEPDRAAGTLLLLGVAVEITQSFRHKLSVSQRKAWGSAGFTLLLAVVLLNSAWLAATAVAIVAAVPFGLDAIRNLRDAAQALMRRQPFLRDVGMALVGVAGVVVVMMIGRYGPAWVIGIAAGVRLLSVAVSIAEAPAFSEEDAETSVVADIGLEHPERLHETAARLQEEELARVGVDRGWIFSLVFVLFAIHISRMGFDRTALGILSPLVAVIGDMFVAIILAYAVMVPARLFTRKMTRPIERRGWERVFATTATSGLAHWRARVTRRLLESRMRFAIRLRFARYSLPSAFFRGLQIGLPLAAVIVASVPIWGMSWYFDTENWAAGMWNSWAAARTDTWRAAMTRAVVAAGETTLDGRGFMVTPAGLDGASPFSFIVIGDTGEGDASQHVLRQSLMRAAAAPDVRFVVLSSDVVYPTGAMKDYESRFWLPFMGVRKPVYAIPGNHDWYDALEGFVATFFRPSAARLAMHARIAEDGGVSSTTDASIDADIARAAFLRGQYGVPTGEQQAPFFQIQTPGFALLAIDTGVLRGVDDEQLIWLRGALEQSRGKLVMAILGHPFLAGGEDVVHGDEQFTHVRDLLNAHRVPLVMAGDTHDLEYYRESVGAGGAAFTVHHFVNGGGGAYLSFGTALAWPKKPVTSEWAYYPAYASVVAKIDTYTPWWKRPAWFWTRQFGAWPSSAEWLSAMFDYNVAPFFQSFVVITVDPSARTLTIRPWGVHGPLAWKDLAASPQMLPQGISAEQAVEWIVR